MRWRSRHGSRRASAPLRVSDGRPSRCFGTTQTPRRSDSRVRAGGVRGVDGDVHRRVAAADDEDPPARRAVPGRGRRGCASARRCSVAGVAGVGRPGHPVVAVGDDDRVDGDLDRRRSGRRRAPSTGRRVRGTTRSTVCRSRHRVGQAEPVGVVGQPAGDPARGRGSRASRRASGGRRTRCGPCWCSGAACGTRASRAPRTPTGRRPGRRRRSRRRARRRRRAP